MGASLIRNWSVGTEALIAREAIIHEADAAAGKPVPEPVRRDVGVVLRSSMEYSGAWSDVAYSAMSIH